MKSPRAVAALLVMLTLLMGYVPNAVYMTEAQVRREGEVRFRGVVVDPLNYRPQCDPAYYCIYVEEIIDDQNNIFGGSRGAVGIFPELYNPNIASIGDAVEVYASCDVDYARDPALMCHLSRNYHYIRRLSGQTVTVTVTSTVTSTITRYTTVTSNTVTRTVTGTRTSYVTSTTATDVTETYTVTRTTTTTVTRTTTTTVTEQRLSPMASAKITSFIISNEKAKPGDTISFTFKIKNTGSVRGWGWPYVLIVGPASEGYINAGHVFGSPVLIEPGETVIKSERWTIPPDAPAGEYMAIGFIYDQEDPSARILDSKGGWFMIGGTSFLQVSSKRLIRIHVERADIPKLKGMVGGDRITLHQLFVVLKSSGLSYDITDDDIFLDVYPYYITLPRDKDLDLTIYPIIGNVGRIYEGTITDALRLAVEEERDRLLSQLPVIGGIYGAVQAARKKGPVQGLFKLGVYLLDLTQDTFAGVLLTLIEFLTRFVFIDQALAMIDTPSHYPLRIPDPLSVEVISPKKQVFLPWENIDITVQVSDAMGRRVAGATAYRLYHSIDLSPIPPYVPLPNIPPPTLPKVAYSRMSESHNGVYSIRDNPLVCLILSNIGRCYITIFLAKPGVGARFLLFYIQVDWYGTIIKLLETKHKLYLHIYDDQKRHIGFNRETGEVEIGIPGSYYYDDQNGTIVVLLPSSISVSSVRVDAGDAKELREEYNLTVSIIKGTQVVDWKEVRGVIDKGSTAEYRVEISSDGKVVITKPGETKTTPTQTTTPTTLEATTPVTNIRNIDYRLLTLLALASLFMIFIAVIAYSYSPKGGIKCTSCGSRNRRGAIYCRRCGNRLRS
jgi:hypothetical protein